MSDVNSRSTTRDVKIDAITIVDSLGKARDVTSIFNTLNIYEDIFMPVITGSIQLIDGKDFFGDAGLHGNEFIYIRFTIPSLSDAKYQKSFRIFKASERQPAGKTQAQSYVLHFCSEELVFSNQLTISRKLKGKNSSDYAIDICRYDLKSNLKKLNGGNFERSMGSTDFLLTRYKPLDALEYLASRSYNENESTFLFFENKDGFNFISLESLFKRPPLLALTYSAAKLTQDQTTAAALNANETSNFVFPTVFNVLENTKNSAYNGRLYTLDLITQKYQTKDYTLVNTKNQKVMMDGKFPLNNAKNRNNKAMYEEYETQLNYWLTNKGQTNNPYFISKAYTITESGIEQTILQRRVQLNLLKTTELECTVPGNPLLSAGYLVEFLLPAFGNNLENERLIDPHHSGKYLIRGVRHVITPSSGLQTVLLLCKNSVLDPYPFIKSENPEYNKARDF